MSTDVASTKVIKNKKTNKYELICLETGEVLKRDIHQQDFSSYRFNQTQANLICELLTQGRSMVDISAREDTPPLSVIHYWRRTNQLFDEEVRWARKARAEYYHDQVLSLADNVVDKDDIAVAKFKAEQYKWAAEKGDPSSYGNKVEHSGKVESAQTLVVVTGINRTAPIEIVSEVVDGEKISDTGQQRALCGTDGEGIHGSVYEETGSAEEGSSQEEVEEEGN